CRLRCTTARTPSPPSPLAAPGFYTQPIVMNLHAGFHVFLHLRRRTGGPQWAFLSELVDRMDLVDIGANLGHESFQHDMDAVLQRAAAHGVDRLVVTGASREGSEHAVALATTHPGR